jgi:hypothetical protein
MSSLPAVIFATSNGKKILLLSNFILHTIQTKHLKIMTLKTLLFLNFLAILFYGSAQDTAQLKRTPYKLTVAVDKKTVYEEDINATPYVLPENTVQIYPGETVYLETHLENGTIKSMKAVKEITDSSKTLIVSFTQTVEKKVHQMMTLKIKNPFKKQLVYQASIYILKAKRWVQTDVLPVEPGLSGFETWPDVITSIGLGKWVLKG